MYLNKSMLSLAIGLISSGILFFLYGQFPPFAFLVMLTGIIIAISMIVFGWIVRRSVTIFEMAGILLGWGVLSFLGYGWVGATVDKQGVLHESFFLVPLGFLLIFIGIILGLVYFLLKKIKHTDFQQNITEENKNYKN